MILTRMGPVDPIKSTGGKLVATFYCLFTGIAFLTLTAIILAPNYYRSLHMFHLEDEETEQGLSRKVSPETGELQWRAKVEA